MSHSHALALTRRDFFARATTLASGLIVLPQFLGVQAPQQTAPPPLKGELVKEFVIAGHNNLERVKEMLIQEPGLLNATWDWKAGDFESALGGAGHMGRKDIANFLLEQGARMDIFVAAMLGK
ncbi:hypothetical protein HUU05_07185, partial [candidate division KSB1 bacterium]|nr:hypothetical protein [candidate division KSB1 bacterium]